MTAIETMGLSDGAAQAQWLRGNSPEGSGITVVNAETTLLRP